jgi:hypothetical protein
MNLDTVVGRKGRATQSPADPRRHQRKCSICNHKDREAIESDFLIWHPAPEILRQYGIASRSVLYRHAQATGLLARRKQNFCTVLDSIIEQAESALVTGHTIIRAIRAYSCIRANGRWVEPPRSVIVHRPASDESSTSGLQPHTSSVENLIGTPGLENAPTR